MFLVVLRVGFYFYCCNFLWVLDILEKNGRLCDYIFTVASPSLAGLHSLSLKYRLRFVFFVFLILNGVRIILMAEFNLGLKVFIIQEKIF